MDHQGTGRAPAHALERLIFFSDAVFAIAITLLVIEIHVPHLPFGAPDRDYLVALARLGPNFAGFFLSFFVIGAFWAGHHRGLDCATHWDQRLGFPNLLMLCAIAAMPFFTAFVSNNPGARVPTVAYCTWLAVTALLNVRLQRIVTSPPVVGPHADPARIATIRRRGLAVLLGALTGVGLSVAVPFIGQAGLISIPLWRLALERRARPAR